MRASSGRSPSSSTRPRRSPVILDKAAAFTDARKIDPAVLLATRLYPDMFPLARQVQTAADHAKSGAGHLAGAEIPRFADTEKTFAELKERIAKTVAFIEGLDRAAFEGVESREVTFMTGGRERTLSGLDYLFRQSMPNFYFHVTTAYAILRHLGVEIGKRDFMGS
jgi:hypothetical protein